MNAEALREAWAEYRRSPAAVAALLGVAAVALRALLAPWIAPQDPYDQAALDLFDALGSAEKTLHANMGGHTGVPRSASESAGRFLARHLRGDGDPAPAR